MKEKTLNLIFFCAYFLTIVSDIFNNVIFLESVLVIVDIVSIFLLVVVIFDKVIYRKVYTYKELIGLLILLVFIMYSAFKSDNRALLKLPFLLIAFKGIDFNNFIKKDFYFRIVLVGTLLFMYSLGLTNNGVLEIRNGFIRNSFGTGHPNEIAFYLTMICLDYYYIESLKEKAKMGKPILLSIAVCILIFLFMGSRTNILLISMLSIIFLLRNKIKIWLNNKIFINIISNLFLICLIVTLLLTYFYKSDNSIMSSLNKILSNRIFISNLYIDAYTGITLFGRNLNNTQLPLDNAYINLYLRYGIMLTIYISIIYYKSFKNMIAKKQNYILIFIMALFLIYGLSETPMYIPAKNPYIMLLLLAFIDNNKSLGEEKENENNNA